MAKLNLTMEHLEAAVLGGCVLGGGGGGSMEKGLRTAKLGLELAPVTLVDPEDLDEDTVLVNVSNVGAPSAADAWVEPMDNGRVVKVLCEKMGIRAGGIITNEAGGSASVNGWLQSALLGLPVVDAPCNGRAHPTGVMGSMGLHKIPDYYSFQAAVGGKRENGRRIEMAAGGSLSRVARLVRETAVEADGLVAVARNPVTLAYAKENGACGAVRQAIELGLAMMEAKAQGACAVLNAVCSFLGANILVNAKVEQVDLRCGGGFDTGVIKVGDVELTFWNEYMTAEKNGERIATFPDLIMTFDAETGTPVTSAEIREGMTAAVIVADKSKIKLGAGMMDPELFIPCEKAVEKEMISYAFPEVGDNRK